MTTKAPTWCYEAAERIVGAIRQNANQGMDEPLNMAEIADLIEDEHQRVFGDVADQP